MRLVGVREEFPLEGVKIVVEILFKLNDISLFRLARACVEISVVEIVVVADLCEEVFVGFQSINMSPRNESHSKTVGRLVGGVDVPAVVVVVEVVVAASQEAAP